MSAPKEGELIKNGTAMNAGGQRIQVVSLLGGGGQGEVYLVNGADGRQYALKWYFPASATQTQMNILNRLVNMGSPDRRFLWPLAVVGQPGVPGFGYLMHLRDKRFHEVQHLMLGKVSAKRRSLAMSMVQIANSFLNLHTKGMFYGDVNFGNFFFDPSNGDLMICDNDNVQIEGVGEATVLGFGEFRAPEIVRGQATPSKYTDQHSLAVLLFYMFLFHHPFEGKLLDEIPGFIPDKDVQIYGKPAAFIFHPTDRSNALADPGISARWAMLPTFIRRRFLEAFVDKINTPYGRVVETIWQKELLKLHDSIVPCPACKRESYYDKEALKPGTGNMGACWKCKQPIPLPPRLRLVRSGDEKIVCLSGDTSLYSAHIGEQETWDLSRPLATVEAHPKFPNVLGLKNNTDRSWLCTMPDGSRIDVKPQTRLKLQNNVKIQFGRVNGEFRC